MPVSFQSDEPLLSVSSTDSELQRTVKRVLKDPKISEANTQDLEEFLEWLGKHRSASASRAKRYLESARKIMRHNPDLRIRTADQEMLRMINRQINRSAWYHDDYAAETKKEYRKFLRTFLRCFNHRDSGHDTVPDRAAWLSTHVPQQDQDLTPRSQLPRPSHVAELCRQLSSIKYQALLLTHWELGARIGETINLRVQDYDRHGNGRGTLYVRGNKTSHDREAMIFLATPALDRYLEQDHPAPDDPDAQLFPHQHDPSRTCGYKYLADQLTEIKDYLGLDIKVNTHAYRKARITFLKCVLEVNESNIDHRVGHVVGSDETRKYTRPDDTTSNASYADGYGLQPIEELTVEDDVLPKICLDCATRLPGWVQTCPECDGRTKKLVPGQGHNRQLLDQAEASLA